MPMPNEAPKARILLVEDEGILALAESRLFEGAGHSVATAGSGEEALKLVREGSYDLILMDIDLGKGMDGGEAARRIREAGGPPVVFLSSHSEETAISKTRGSGAYGFILKGSPDRVLLASARMALELSSALRSLAESESRWASLSRNAADYIVSIAPDGRILFCNRPLGGERGTGPGARFSSFALEESRAAVDSAIERAFAERVFTRQLLRAPGPGSGPIAYEALFGPAGTLGAPEYLTAVLREVVRGSGPSTDEAPRSEERHAVLEATLSSLDFARFRPLVEGLRALTGLQVSILAREDRFLVSTPFARACAAFHRSAPASLALCDAAGRAAQIAEPEPGGPGYVERLCPLGLRDISVPLSVEGIRWGTMFAGQFLFDDDDAAYEGAARRADENGWDASAYRSALSELPRFSRSRMAEIMTLFVSIAGLVSDLAASLYRERMLERPGKT